MKQEEEEVMMENDVEEEMVVVVDESRKAQHLPYPPTSSSVVTLSIQINGGLWQSCCFFVVDKVLKILAHSCTNTCLYTCN